MSLPDAGALLLMFAWIVAVFGAGAALAGARAGSVTMVESAWRSSMVIAVLLGASALILERALVTHDFSVRFVAETTNRAMPVSYLVTGLWGGQAGSLLYWCLASSFLTLAAVWWARRHAPDLHGEMLGILLLTQVLFLGVLALVSNPFERLPIVPADGRGMNPLLLDGGMRVHPPFLLAGYASFVVPFALTAAALTTGRLGPEWSRALRPWALLSWVVQGAGLLLGGWWAYRVLGWGGYWGWDPVENVALLPWLVGTALIHALLVHERRGLLRTWTAALSLGAYCLAVLGTFVVRSGVLSSVHAFAESPLGPIFFGILAVLMLGALGLVLRRLPELTSAAGSGERPRIDAAMSREAGILANNWLLIGITAATLWGTIFPLFAEATRGVKLAIGPQFFREANGPLFLALLVLLGIGPPLGWRRTSRSALRRVFGWPAAVSLLGAMTLLALGVDNLWAVLALTAATLVAATIVAEVVRVSMARRHRGENVRSGLGMFVVQNRRRYSAHLAHLAVAVLAVGFVGSTFFQIERTVVLERGATAAIGAYTIEYDGAYRRGGPGYRAAYADLRLSGPGGEAVLRPERRTHDGWEAQPVSVVAIQTTWPRLDDVYVFLNGWEDDGSVVLQVYVNPLVCAVWLGGGLMLLAAMAAGWPALKPAAISQMRVEPVPSTPGAPLLARSER